MFVSTHVLVGSAALFGLFLAVPSASAQGQAEPPNQPPVIRVEVRQVLVPVVVADRHGHHVPSLKASDFEVLEDGRVQRIVAFGTEHNAPIPVSTDLPPAPAAAPTVSPASNDPRHTYLILLDSLHSSLAHLGRAREALIKFFDKEQNSDAQYAVIALGRQLSVVQDSTRDLAAVLAALKASRFPNLIQDSESASLAAATEQFTALMREYCSQCACTSAGTTQDQPGCNSPKSRVQMFLTSFGERTFFLNQTFLRQLREIVNATASMPTSRTIIFISDGFSRFSGGELYAILLGYGPKTLQFNPRDTQPDLDSALKLATRHDVKFYALDSRGLYGQDSVPGSGFDASTSSATHTQMDSRESPNLAAGVPEAASSGARSAARANTDVLFELAHETGGVFFENNNDLLKGLRQAVADGREYYVLAYVSDNTATDGGYRKIAVTVKDPKWRVIAKAGYWATAN